MTGRTEQDRLAAPAELKQRIDQRLEAMTRDAVIRRIYEGDHTVWKDDPTEITRPDRLGWLTVADGMLGEVPRLEGFAAAVCADGLKTVVLLGMGGSSLAPEVLYNTFGARNGGLDLRVLDTTVPADVIALEKAIDINAALFIVASKSGTTIETTSQLAYFWEKLPDGAHFVAITDPGTPLAATAQEREFRALFLNPDSMGGRYSALSFFGLVPAALMGVDLRSLLTSAQTMAQACKLLVPAENPGARLGAVLGETAQAGRDKLTLVLPTTMASLGDWVEQLVAESTGKEGKGIVPVVGEPLGAPAVYGNDRLFVALGEHEGLDVLEAAGHPVMRLPYEGRDQLGSEFFRWEFAIASAGYVLGINPFDQPDVQRAKDAAASELEAGEREVQPSATVRELLDSIKPGDYAALQAYLPRSEAVRGRLAALRLKLRDRYRVATTAGFGPRYLHSTGQLHKGGPNTGVFFQLIDGGGPDVPVPGRPYTFGGLLRAQARGDFEALRALGRRVTRVRLEELEEALR